jgi:hypothetical protein
MRVRRPPRLLAHGIGYAFWTGRVGILSSARSPAKAMDHAFPVSAIARAQSHLTSQTVSQSPTKALVNRDRGRFLGLIDG